MSVLSRTCGTNIPTQAKTGLEWATRRNLSEPSLEVLFSLLATWLW